MSVMRSLAVHSVWTPLYYSLQLLLLCRAFQYHVGRLQQFEQTAPTSRLEPMNKVKFKMVLSCQNHSLKVSKARPKVLLPEPEQYLGRRKLWWQCARCCALLQPIKSQEWKSGAPPSEQC